MYSYILKKLIILLLLSLITANNYNQPTADQRDEMLRQMFQAVWTEAMNAKQQLNEVLPRTREELLENLCSSAPAVNFITHADLSDTLSQAENTSASVFVSTDNQSSWIENNNVYPLDQQGYESTWGASTLTDGGNNIHWYLKGSIDSGYLGLDFGQITVSQSPHNINNTWPPSDNLYATLVTDDAGDNAGGGSGQDITNLRATYFLGDTTTTSDDKLYVSMGLNGGCCDDGSFFGPWNLYSIAIVNPDAANPVAYAYAYGNGGFGQLYPAIYKIDGDLTSGEVGGFAVLSENFSYSTNGNTLQASSLLDIITNDAEWGEWPNSFNGLALVGTTVAAGLDGLDISTNILDTSDLAVLVMSTGTQNGNNAPVLSDASFDSEAGYLSVVYTDLDNNLATMHEVLIDDMVFVMTPDSHTYAEGVIFSASGVGGDAATLYFSDGGGEIITLEVELGGSSCSNPGDANGDSSVDVLDVVLTVNIILCADCPDNYNVCSDLNGDMAINVLDVVSIVNTILSPAN